MADKADLHIHTTCSDGRLSPEEAVKLASNKGLKALSITDHDTFDGYNEARSIAREEGIELIPGIEITTVYKDRECHLLAYYFDSESSFLNDFVLRQRRNRKNRIKGIIDKLIDHGIEVSYDEVWAVANGANIGRPHLADVLVEKGYVGNLQEAFMRYLSAEQLGGIESAYPNIEDAIAVVKEAGGAAILAHPSRFYTEEEIEDLISKGLDGLECIHPSHNWSLQKKYSELCEQYSLLKTGGSDYHGDYQSSNAHVGVVTIAQKYVDQMKRMTDQRKNMQN